jgi:hypothetical protein
LITFGAADAWASPVNALLFLYQTPEQYIIGPIANLLATLSSLSAAEGSRPGEVNCNPAEKSRAELAK